jgi:hypothetical protein
MKSLSFIGMLLSSIVSHVAFGEHIPALLYPVNPEKQVSGCFFSGLWLLGGSIDGAYNNVSVANAIKDSRVTNIHSKGIVVNDGATFSYDRPVTAVWGTSREQWPDRSGYGPQAWTFVLVPSSDTIYYKSDFFNDLIIMRKVRANPCIHRSEQ